MIYLRRIERGGFCMSKTMALDGLKGLNRSFSMHSSGAILLEDSMKKDRELDYRPPWDRTYWSIMARCRQKKPPKNYYYKKGIKCLITKDELKTLWFRNKAYLLKRPSINRKDNNGDYTLANCNYIELDTNLRVSHPSMWKPIAQFDKNGIFIRTWDSLMPVVRELGISRSFLAACASGKVKFAYGYKFKYITNDEREEYEKLPKVS